MAVDDMLAIYSPAEAWEELQSRRHSYYDLYNAPFSGDHRLLAQTALPGSFWKRGSKVKQHVPVAADIAATSASLLFGEEPRFSIYDASDGDAEDSSQPRLDAILAGNGFVQKINEAAETASAAGDVFLKCRYDQKALDMPSIQVVRGADGLAEYRLGQLQCIHFFTVLKTDIKTGNVWRVYECYKPGAIESMIFLGQGSSLGEEQPQLLEQLGMEPHVATPTQMMLAAHIANMKPSRLWLTDDKGRSDFEGLRDLLDSLDEIYTSWLRDIRLAKSRLIVPAEFLRRKPEDMFADGSYKYEFDEDVETLVALDMGNNDQEQKITPSQFAIRSNEHSATYEMTLRTILSMAGYSPQTFGLDISGNAESGTARRIMEKKSLSTNAKKQSYWKAPLENFLTAVMQLDKALYGNSAWQEDQSVQVEMRDPVVTGVSDIAGSVSLLRNAQAASTDTLVKMLHPDWQQAKVDEEVQKIIQENGLREMADLNAGDDEA